jgi:hypothetical protein
MLREWMFLKRIELGSTIRHRPEAMAFTITHIPKGVERRALFKWKRHFRF